MQDYVNEYAEHVLHFPTQLEHGLGVWLKTAGHTKAKPNYRVGPRMRNYYSLHIVLEGRLWFKAPEESYELEAGDLFCMSPNEVYEYGILESASPLRMYWVSLDGPNAGLLMEQTGLNSQHSVRRSLPSDYQRLIYTIFNQARHKNASLELSLTADLFQLLNQLSSNSKQGTSQGASSHDRHPNWLMDSTAFIDMHYRENLTVEQVAEWVGVSRTHFSQYFTLHKGVTPSSYIEGLRMKEAKELLEETDLTVTEIALSLGYHDLYSFSRSFKRRTGETPTRFRTL